MDKLLNQKYGMLVENGFVVIPRDMLAAIRKTDITYGAFELFMILLEHLRPDRKVHIKQSTILEKLGLSENSVTTVKRHLKQLVNAKIIKVSQKFFRSVNEYDLSEWIESLQTESKTHFQQEKTQNVPPSLREDLNTLKDCKDMTDTVSDPSPIIEALNENLKPITIQMPGLDEPVAVSEYSQKIYGMLERFYSKQLCPELIHMMCEIHYDRVESYGKNTPIKNPIGWFKGCFTEALAQWTFIKHLPEQERTSKVKEMMNKRWSLLRWFNQRQAILNG